MGRRGRPWKKEGGAEEERRNKIKRNREPSQGKEKKEGRETKAVAKREEGFFLSFPEPCFPQAPRKPPFLNPE